MWRRIHYNRDPRDTLLSELQKEFGTYINVAAAWITGMLHRNPKIAFWLMVVVLALSTVLSFTVYRHPDTVKQPVPSLKASAMPVHQGFDQILESSVKIKETLRLKHLVDSISAKKSLNAADSLALDSALSQLQRIK